MIANFGINISKIWKQSSQWMHMKLGMIAAWQQMQQSHFHQLTGEIFVTASVKYVDGNGEMMCFNVMKLFSVQKSTYVGPTY